MDWSGWFSSYCFINQKKSTNRGHYSDYFESFTGDGTAIWRGHPSHVNVLLEVPSFLSYFRNLIIRSSALQSSAVPTELILLRLTTWTKNNDLLLESSKEEKRLTRWKKKMVNFKLGKWICDNQHVTSVIRSLHSSSDRTLARCSGDHRFESCRGIRIFFFVPRLQHAQLPILVDLPMFGKYKANDRRL